MGSRKVATLADETYTPVYEHNIHVVLGLATDVFARLGGRGMYALVTDGVATTDGLVEEMNRIVSNVDTWLSSLSVWKRLPRGNPRLRRSR